MCRLAGFGGTATGRQGGATSSCWLTSLPPAALKQRKGIFSVQNSFNCFDWDVDLLRMVERAELPHLALYGEHQWRA